MQKGDFVDSSRKLNYNQFSDSNTQRVEALVYNYIVIYNGVSNTTGLYI